MFVRNGAVTPGPSRKSDITFFVKGRPKSARQSRDGTVVARRVQSVTIPSSPVSRECRSPGLRSPPFKNARIPTKHPSKEEPFQESSIDNLLGALLGDASSHMNPLGVTCVRTMLMKFAFQRGSGEGDHRVLQGAAQRGAQFHFYGSPDPFFMQQNEPFLP